MAGEAVPTIAIIPRRNGSGNVAQAATTRASSGSSVQEVLSPNAIFSALAYGTNPLLPKPDVEGFLHPLLRPEGDDEW